MNARKLLLLCAAALVGAVSLITTAAASPVKATDYQSRSHWLFLPAEPLKKKVDVFYLYPSEYERAPGGPLIGPIDDPGMMQRAAVAFQRQATAFRTVANIYAPYYRQADAASRAAMPQEEQVKVVAGAPTIDGIAAFKHFLKHFNQGRPFILVGHSLGSNVMANLLAEYMGAHPRVYKRMIAAYVVGYSITPSYLAKHPFLKFAKGPSDTGVIASWNTEAPTVDGTNPVLLPGGIAINPITWTRKTTRGERRAESRLHRAGPGDRRAPCSRARQDQALHERRGRPRRQGQGRRDLQHHRPWRTRRTSLRADSPWACCTASTTLSTSSASGPTPPTGSSTSSRSTRLRDRLAGGGAGPGYGSRSGDASAGVPA